MENVACVLCGSTKSRLLIEAHDVRYGISPELYRVVECEGCGLAYLNPRPGKDEIGAYYSAGYRTLQTIKSEERIRRKMKRYSAPNAALFFKNPWYLRPEPEARILDVGCGAGELLIYLREIGCDPCGMDLNPASVEYLVSERGLDVRRADMSEGAPFADDSFDMVVMRHSLEHSHDPIAALREVKRILKPSGELLAGVPNIKSAVASITREGWNDLDLPRHLYHFSPETLRAALETAGFTSVKITHELKVSAISIARSGPPFLSLMVRIKPLRTLLGAIFSLAGKGEWIAARAQKGRT